MPKPGKLPEEPKGPADPADPDLIYAFKVDGVRYELHGDWFWGAENELRSKTGRGFLRTVLLLQSRDTGKDVLGSLMWLSLIEKGEEITLDEAHKLVTYRSEWVLPDPGLDDYRLNPDYQEPDEEEAPAPLDPVDD